MLFYILISTPLLAPLVGAVAFLSSRFGKLENAGFGFGLVFFLSIPPLLIAMLSWESHARDLSKVHAQEAVIEVQEERIESLTARLESFNYPSKPTVSLDADTPWASMTKSLTDAEDKLARAKSERAIAIRSIEARRHGPMSGVVSWVGDYRR